MSDYRTFLTKCEERYWRNHRDITLGLLLFAILMGAIGGASFRQSRINLLALETCQKQTQECVNGVGALRRDNSTISGQLRDTTAQKDAFETTLRRALDDSARTYDLLGRATIRLSIGCHGVLVKYQGEVIVLTAEHCLRTDRRTKEDGSYKLSYYLEEEKPANNFAYHVGYGYLESDPVAAEYTTQDMVVSGKYDLGYIRGLPELREPEVTERALTVAANTPDPLHVVYSTHWQPHCWNLAELGGGCAEGENLGPNFGISSGQDAYRTNFYEYALIAYPGDSGSGIVNELGQLIGIVSGAESDKTRRIYTEGSGPRTINMFLESTWRNRRK